MNCLNARNGGSNLGTEALAYCAASESCAFPSTAKLDFELQPGEIVELSKNGIKSVCQVMKPSFKDV